MSEQKIAMRTQVQVFLNTGTGTAPVWTRCGDGWKKFAENPNAQTESCQYINQASETTDTTSYSPQYSFECDLMYTDPTIKKVYDVAKDRKTGSDAVLDFLIVDTFEAGSAEGTYVARREKLAVAVTSLDGTKKMSMSGNLNSQGDGVKGTFKPKSGSQEAVFTENAAEGE